MWRYKKRTRMRQFHIFRCSSCCVQHPHERTFWRRTKNWENLFSLLLIPEMFSSLCTFSSLSCVLLVTTEMYVFSLTFYSSSARDYLRLFTRRRFISSSSSIFIFVGWRWLLTSSSPGRHQEDSMYCTIDSSFRWLKTAWTFDSDEIQSSAVSLIHHWA